MRFANEAATKISLESLNNIALALNEKWGRESADTQRGKNSIFTALVGLVESFLQDDRTNLAIFEFPEMENTEGVMLYTQLFFKAVFYIAKEKNSFGKRVCLALEEAHTVIPEWNFSGVNEKFSQPVLNTMAQIALQGRKYNIGLLVIAQRSAIVSKTILTQCNSIVSFQSFDKTSTEFLAAYLGSDVAGSLSRLKFKQAYAVGKAFRSSVPMLFEVPHIESESSCVTDPVQNNDIVSDIPF